MLSVTDSPQCHMQGCKYNLEGRCGLNLKNEGFIIEQQCVPTDNWYIIGSFVLDRIFEKPTANDIDLITPTGEMPAELPDEVLSSPLRIEMLWKDPKAGRFECYNTSLPRISSKGLQNWEVADTLRKKRTISALPRVRKVAIESLYIAIKPMVKYDMRPDQKTFGIWVKSIQDPLRWKRLYRWIIELRGIKSVNWDYLRAEHLIDWLDLAYSESTDTQRKQYLQCLRVVLAKMPLNTDIAYQFLMKWVEASMENNDQKKKQIQETIRSLKFDNLLT